jgi:gas vesicle protein
MTNNSNTEYLTAFVVGALLGAGAALLLAPDPPTRRERFAKKLKPYQKKLRKNATKVRKQAGDQAASVAEWSDDLVSAGRSVMAEFRDEMAEMVADARDDLAHAVEGQLDSAHTSLRRGVKRIRS